MANQYKANGGEVHFRGQVGEILVRKAELEELIKATRDVVSSDEEYRLLLKAVTNVFDDVAKLLDEIGKPHEDDNGRSPGALGYPNKGRRGSGHHGVGSSPLSPCSANVASSAAVHYGEPRSGHKLPPLYAAGPSYRKTSSYPDQHKLFLSHLNIRTSENTLYHYFSQYGTIIDLRIFELPAPRKWNVACVGFEDIGTARALLHKKFFIDGEEIIPKPYRSNTRPIPAARSVKQTEYQIFLGGIPVQADVAIVQEAIRPHLIRGIRDVRVLYINENDRVRHRGFAYIDLESMEDAKYLLNIRYIQICNRKVECKPNTRTKAAILNDPKTIPPELLADDDVENDDETCTGEVEHVQTEGSNMFLDVTGTNGDCKRASGENDICVICKTNPRDCLMLWCGHNDTCYDCGIQLKNCPKIGCGGPIDKREKLNDD
ncbi:uncharacterized protein LOC129602587 isoform X2 [Paramacrobiotus metropolitanus]|nr:uncharacterized protein LOC129602587 isoform X2 [Paramacrobiotus metropolitanus]